MDENFVPNVVEVAISHHFPSDSQADCLVVGVSLEYAGLNSCDLKNSCNDVIVRRTITGNVRVAANKGNWNKSSFVHIRADECVHAQVIRCEDQLTKTKKKLDKQNKKK